MGGIWLCGFTETEFFVDIALFPLERTKVKIQTSPWARPLSPWVLHSGR